LAGTARYKAKVDALCCFKGISTTAALTFATEIGDVRRFDHPTTRTPKFKRFDF